MFIINLNLPKEGRESGEQIERSACPAGPRNQTQDLLRASQGSVTAHHGHFFDKSTFPWV